MEDEYVVGGELGYCNDSEAIEFITTEEPQVARCLLDERWSGDISLTELHEHVRAMQTTKT
jgi:hypothetical protein